MVEYVALISVALIAACLLVRFATPAERIARDIAHAVTARPRRPVTHLSRHSRHRTHRAGRAPCLCPLSRPGRGPRGGGRASFAVGSRDAA